MAEIPWRNRTRIAPQAHLRFSGGVLGCAISLPVGGRLIVLELLAMPGHPGHDLIKANIFAIWEQDLADQPPVGFLFAAVEVDRLPETRLERASICLLTHGYLCAELSSWTSELKRVARRSFYRSTCPRCKNPNVYKLNFKPWHWQCRLCQKNGYRFSVITATIFQDTKIPLKTWFKVGYLMLSSKKGMSALQLHRMMHQSAGSEYKTFWYMCHRLRAAMKNMEWDTLMGEVEVDETYVGGKTKTGTNGRTPTRPGARHPVRCRSSA